MHRRLVAVLAVLAALLHAGGAWVTPGIDAAAGHLTPAPAPLAVRGPLTVTMVRGAGALPAAAAETLADQPGVELVVPLGERQAFVSAVTDADRRAVHGWSDGWSVPIDLLGAEPASLAELLPPGASADAVRRLQPGEVLLGATEARLRGVAADARLMLRSERALAVVGIVPDELVNAAGGLVHRDTFEGFPARFLAVGQRLDADSTAVVATVEALGLHSRDLGRAPWPRTWREVTPLSWLKSTFGEFAVAPAAGRRMQMDEAWVQSNIRTRDVPVLGSVTCHRLVLEDLERALDQIIAAGLAGAVDPGDYAGCWSPRTTHVGGPVSRHAFGIALDVNATGNGLGAVPTLDPRVVAIFESAGFWWGGRWPRPDGMHMEHAGRAAVD